jgi:hypothetical protein
MKTCIQDFRTGVGELLAFLIAVEHEVELTGLLLSEQRHATLEERERMALLAIAAARTDKKRYVYAVGIVSLYGLLERLVDRLIEAYVVRVAALVNSYDELPNAIKKTHTEQSIDLIKQVGEDWYRGQLTQEQIVANLHSCLSKNSSFNITKEAFTARHRNTRLEQIAKMLNSIGVNPHLRKFVSAKYLQELLSKVDPERDMQKISDADLPALLQPIDDLVERRNQVAHGVTPDEIESIDLLKERCSFILAYGEALYEVLVQDILPYEIKHPSVIKLGAPIKVYNNRIVCFESEQGKVSLGDSLIAETKNGMIPFRYGDILNLQIDKENHNSIEIKAPTKFGAEVSFHASDKHTYYLLPRGVI